MYIVEIRQIYAQPANAVAVVKPVTRLKFATKDGAALFAYRNKNQKISICIYDENEPDKKEYP